MKKAAMDVAESTSVLGKIEAYLTKPRRMLTFDREIEAIFLRDRSPARSRQAYLAGLVAVLSFNAMVCGEFASGEFAAAGLRVFLALHLIVTIPCLLGCYAVRRGVSMTWLEALMATGYGLGTIGAVVINQNIRGDAAIYDAFTNVLILICCNIALPMAFLTAAIGSLFSVAALIASALLHSDFTPQAQGALSALYVLSAVTSLVANYRFELAQRINYLSYLRERVRNVDIRRDNERLSHLSRTDALTGLPNRRDFDDRLAAAVMRSRGEGRSLAALVLDIDNFKLYNDVHGHPEGDVCLRKVAQAVAGALCDDEWVACRIGGEEFAVVLPGAAIETAIATAGRMRAAVQALQIPHFGLADRSYVTISVGVASLNPLRPEDPASLIARADAALYKAKRSGRDKIEIDLRTAA
jgi:diguanylate cyclase (GGDEF)-like protein